MKCSSLFRFHAVAVQLLCIGAIVGFSFQSAFGDSDSDGNSGNNGNALLNALAAHGNNQPQLGDDDCQSAKRKRDAAQDLLGACDGKPANECRKQLAKCQSIAADAGAKLQSDDDDSDTETVCAVSGDKAAACGYAVAQSPSDVKEQLRSLKDERRDAIKDCNDLTKQSSEADTKNAEAANKNNDEAVKGNKEFSQQMLDISKQMRDALTGMNDATAKAAADGLKQQDQLRQAGMKLQEELSRKVDAKNTTYVKWQGACLTAAEDARQKVEDEFDKFMNELKAHKKNYAFSTAAGLRLRLLKQKLKKERQAYNDMKSKCMMGTKGPGTELKVAFDQAKRDVDTSTANYKNQLAEINRQNLVNQMQLEQARQQNYQKYQSAVSDLQQRQQQMQTDRMQDQMNQAQKQQRDGAVMQKNAAQTATDLKKCEDNLDSLKNKIAGAELQLNKCLPSYGVKSDENIKDKEKASKNAGAAMAAYKSACEYANSCPMTPKAGADTCSNYKVKKQFKVLCDGFKTGSSDAAQDPGFDVDMGGAPSSCESHDNVATVAPPATQLPIAVQTGMNDVATTTPGFPAPNTNNSGQALDASTNSFLQDLSTHAVQNGVR
jgi:hypothetical protein